MRRVTIKKLVRFNRKKHKINPWLTAGILKSINSKDKLYKTLVQTPKDSINYPALLSNPNKLLMPLMISSLALATGGY